MRSTMPIKSPWMEAAPAPGREPRRDAHRSEANEPGSAEAWKPRADARLRGRLLPGWDGDPQGAAALGYALRRAPEVDLGRGHAALFAPHATSGRGDAISAMALGRGRSDPGGLRDLAGVHLSAGPAIYRS